MAPTKAVAWLLIFVSLLRIDASQKQNKEGPPSFEYTGICDSVYCSRKPECIMKLRNCTVVLGYIKIVIMEKATREDFVNISFPELREVTGFLAIYRVFGLESVGQLFPNLGRIRGTELMYNFALMVFDMPDLLEIGLYGLLKIDRGGVIMWGGALTCYTDTIRWDLITNGRHIMFGYNLYPKCHVVCSCSLNSATNFCWNNRKCQRFLEGPEAEKCDSQCFGCKKRNPTECSLCRNYTHKNRCVSECPRGTIVLPVNKYCLTVEECNQHGGWSWNNSCLFQCPENYKKLPSANGTICKRCDNCEQTCQSLQLNTLENIQSAEKCVYINGSLTIAIRSILPEVLDEMRLYISKIQEVSDYIFIHSSISISSLDFLSSLRRIRGRKLLNGTYSLIVSGMHNLQTLFMPNVTQNLKVDNGTLGFFDNPMLCMSYIEKLTMKFPQMPHENDIPLGFNGYSGGCDEVFLQLKVEVKNESSAVAIFNRDPDLYVNYTILYVLIPQGSYATFVPETCSESEWDAINVPYSAIQNHTVHVEISSLHPASSYALCIESYDPVRRHLARSSIVNFNTTVGKPEPPFIIELVASSSNVIVIRWVDHKNYRPHIDHYELDVYLVDIRPIDIAARDHCIPAISDPLDLEELDYSRHVVVMRPPKDYERGCESMCGILSTTPVGAVIEEYFDVCSIVQPACDEDENHRRPSNSSIGRYVKTLVLNLTSPRTDFQIGNLAPFRDYRFQLRACTKDKCSRHRSGVVRTLRLESADVPHINFIWADAPGVISIEWLPPKETNGPVLAYIIEILPIVPEMEKLFPGVWCVPYNVTSYTVKYDIAKKYGVRVCSKTLGSNYVCSSSKNIVVPRSQDVPMWWWVGCPVAIIFCFVSIAIGWLMKSNQRSDEIRLIDMSISYRNESDPPSQMNSDVPSFSFVKRV